MTNFVPSKGAIETILTNCLFIFSVDVPDTSGKHILQIERQPQLVTQRKNDKNNLMNTV